MPLRNGLLVVPLIFLLLFSASSVLASRDNTVPLPFQTLIPSGEYEWEQIDAAATTNSISLEVVSNVSISTAFMTSSQFSSFNNSYGEISNALFAQNGTAVQHTLQLSLGDYFLVFYTPVDNANVSYNYQLYPNSPFQAGSLPPPEPTGIASFGLYNDSGVTTPYSVETNEVVGIAGITSLEAYNATAQSANSTVSGATLQLNSVLVVNEQEGRQQVYWAQNTPDFVTSASQLAYGDNVWNFSVSGFLSNGTLTSNEGYVSTYQQDGVEQYYYSYEASNSTYAVPLNLALLMNETATPGKGVLLQMGAQLFRNGSESVTPADWFDNITIVDPTVQSAYFSVDGNDTTPIGTYYDTEFVFGGENNGEATNFNSMSATLGLFYDNASSGLLTSFPSYYSFGQDTAEGADNLQVSFTGNGFTHLSTGTPNYVYLGRSSGQFSLAQVAAMASNSFTLTSTSQSGSSTSSSVSSSSSSSLSLSYASVTAATILMFLGAALWLRVGGRLPSGPARPG